MKKRIVIFSITLILNTLLLGILQGILDFHKGINWFILFFTWGIIVFSYILLELRDAYFERKKWTPIQILIAQKLEEHPIFKKIQIFLGYLIILQLPLILLIVDSKSKIYLPYHLVITSVLLVLNTINNVIYAPASTSLFLKIIFAFTFLYPFTVIAAYPFIDTFYWFVFLLFIIGIIIPFISLKVTWWIYTCGGIIHLNAGSQWLAKYASRYSVGINDSLFRLLFLLEIFLVTTTLLLFQQLAGLSSYPAEFYSMQSMSFLVIFGIALSFGTGLKRSFNNQINYPVKIILPLLFATVFYFFAASLQTKIVSFQNVQANGYILISRFFLARNDESRGLYFANKAASLKPQSAQTYLYLGSIPFGLKEYPNALNYYQTALQLEPKNSKAWDGVGWTKYQLGELEGAKSALQEAINNEPQYAKAHNNLGIVYFDLNLWDQAIEEYKLSIKYDPDYKKPYANLGRAYLQKKMYNLALKPYQKALELDSEYTLAQWGLGAVYFYQRNYSEALSYFKQVYTKKPYFNETDNFLAQAYLALGILDKAERVSKESIRTNPKNIRAYNTLGMIYHQKKDFNQEIQSYQNALKLNPNNQPKDILRIIYENLGLAYNSMQNYDLAQEAFNQALKINPQQADSNLNLGQIYLQKGEIKLAIGEFEEAIKKEPKNALAHNNLGYALVLNGNLDRAIQEFKLALSFDPNLKIAQENLSNYKMYLKDIQ